jgi:Ca2+-binding EF-hand superfamily protein
MFWTNKMENEEWKDEQNLKTLKETFSIYEEPGMGYISKKNVVGMLKCSGFVLDSKEIESIARLEEEFLDFPQIIELIKENYQNKTNLVEDLKLLFENLDTNQQGFADVQTFVNMLNYGNNSLKDEEIKEILHLFEPKDGKIFYQNLEEKTIFNKMYRP